MRKQYRKRAVSVAAILFISFILVPIQVMGTETDSTNAANMITTYTLLFDKIQQEVLEKSPDVADNMETFLDSDTGLQAQYTRDKANYSVVWEVQSYFFQYNGLQKQLNSGHAQLPILENQYNLTKIKASYGVATEQDVLTAEKSLTDLKNNLTSYQKEMDDILKQVRYQLALKSDVKIIVDSVPYENIDFANIEYDQDLPNAMGNSYDIGLADWSGDSTKLSKTVIEFKSSFQTAYGNLKTAVEKVEYNDHYATIDQKTFKLAEIKYKYGSITKQEYLTEEYNYINAQISNDQDKNDLYKAYVKYEWAKKGLIVN
ncbi:TolC family protein [Dehalobacter sp. CF]|nr:TolC family protein [Dehalobacter sp. CF]AFV03694.1 hypothetical protein DHBDCA_p2667 [Dehalobacter sp. DCA]AFV06681.1 hypothetical protein DCF50_p2678 [Dehalobacter sp. CF]